jgi:hypothetical protein
MTSLIARVAWALKAANWILAFAIAAACSALFLSSLACHSVAPTETQPGGPSYVRPGDLIRDDSLAIAAILKANGKSWPWSGSPVTAVRNGRAIGLDLAGLGLDTIPPDIGKLIGLADIDLGRNHLRRLPQAFEELTDLETLRLGDNELDSLPDGFTLASLRELYLPRNRLVALPRNVGVTNLRILDLDENRIRALPPDFRYLSHLVSFSIRGNLLDSLPAAFGPETFPRLTRLALADNAIGALPPGMPDFSLDYLDLGGNRLCLPDTAQADSAQRAWINWLDASDRDWRSTQRCP